MQHRFWKGFLVLGVVLEIIVLVVTGRQTLYPQVVKAQQYAQSQPQLKGKRTFLHNLLFLWLLRGISASQYFDTMGEFTLMRTILQIIRSFISGHTLKISLSTHILLL